MGIQRGIADLVELKKVADWARACVWPVEVADALLGKSAREFMAAASPDAVLALIAEIDRLGKMRALDHELNLERELIGERDQARAECEALRKESDRYRWLRDKSESGHSFYLSVPLWLSGIRFRKEDVDAGIDTAMGNGEQS